MGTLNNSLDPNVPGCQPESSITSGPANPETFAVNRELTEGEKAVGITFNPGGKKEVNQIKKLCAAVIDELKAQQKTVSGEAAAQYQIAIRDIQSGQMWGVKAATWQY